MKENKSETNGDLHDWLTRYPGYRNQVKALRELTGLTQKQLAQKVDLTSRAIRTIENGEVFPRISTLQKIADVMDAELSISLVPKKDIAGLLKDEEADQDPGTYSFPHGDSDFRVGEND